MERIEEQLPAGAAPRFDVDRGAKVHYVDQHGAVRMWSCPYTGPKWVTLERFTATRTQLQQLEQRMRAASSGKGIIRVLQCTPGGPSETDGKGEFTAEWAACLIEAGPEETGPWTAGG